MGDGLRAVGERAGRDRPGDTTEQQQPPHLVAKTRAHHREDIAERLERQRDRVQRERDRDVILVASIHLRCGV